jgi:hypothetical protein
VGKGSVTYNRQKGQIKCQSPRRISPANDYGQPAEPILRKTDNIEYVFDITSIKSDSHLEVTVTSGERQAKGDKKRTLTNLYNARPTWLDLAHKRLDEAVFAAYGWKNDLTDEEILEKLLALNLERSK